MSLAVIVAGGRGLRMGGGPPKPEIKVLGKPLLNYALAVFQDSGIIESVVLVVAPERLCSYSLEMLSSQGFGKVGAVVAGGSTRRESVLEGLRVLPDDGTVVVHDAARPLVTGELISSVCEIPEHADGVVCAVPLTDTVKEVHSGEVVKTLDRSRLVAVQTPQAFRLASIKEAHALAAREGFEGTDDASLVEMAGGKVAVVPGSRKNIKVTYPEDVETVERFLSTGGRK